ncbi:MAG TPA: uroporphyrinogen decarboxylase family protein [Phycisphaerae bacterium]|nr:uroporphyrinogen decarboxylase family protein [Phycisphaerae bacterium]
MERSTPRELFHKVMRFECPGRTLATLGGIWPSTLDRWVAEGMGPALADVGKLIDHLGLQRHIWCSPRASVFTYPPFERKVLAERADKVTYVNPHGVTCTEFRTDAFKSMPHFESYPVRTREDWAGYRERLVWDDGRVGKKWQQQKAEWADRADPLILAFNHGSSLYGSLREIVGVEALSVLFYDDRAWVEEMMDTVAELFCRCVDVMFDNFAPDAFCLWEDMAYKTASLVSPRLVRELMLPRHRRMAAKLREKGVPFIVLDSDGKIDELIPIWLEARIDGFVPMEVQAGMDVAVFRRRYPRMLMMGGVDKRALARGREAIDREMEKIRRTVAEGGFIPWFDHGLPHDVSYANFLYYADRLKDVCGVG